MEQSRTTLFNRKKVTKLTDIGKIIDMLHERLSSFMDTTVLLVRLHNEKAETVNLVKAYEEGGSYSWKLSYWH